MGTFLLVNICSASRDTGKFFLCSLFFLLLSNLTLQAQTEQEWEIVDDSKLAWTPSSNLSVYNNTLKDLSVAKTNSLKRQEVFALSDKFRIGEESCSPLP